MINGQVPYHKDYLPPTPVADRVFHWFPPRYDYTLREDLSIETGRNIPEMWEFEHLTISKEGTIRIKAGWQWDGETVVVDLNLIAGTVHDVLYTLCVGKDGAPFSRADADAIYLELYRCSDSWFQRNMVGPVRYAGVRIFGGMFIG